MARLKLALLGPLRASRDGQPVTSFAYDKVRALLAYLAVEAQRPHDRSALAALLWPGEPEAVARKGLRTALAKLRQAIGDPTATPPLLLVSRDTVQFNPDADYELDVATFTMLLQAAESHPHSDGILCASCAAQLAHAVALYQSEFLQQLSVANSVAWEEWALLNRERLHGQALDALAQLMGYHEAQAEDDAARQYAWRALAIEAWDETAHRCLMRVYARSGQRKAALAQYERCRRVLGEELGVEPVAETTTLYERIRAKRLEPAIEARRGRPTPTYASRPFITNLPAPPNALIGRAQDVTSISARLRQDSVRLLTLIGPPGIGKTRLGLQVALNLVSAFADGVWFVPLASIRDSSLLAAAIAQMLGLQETGDQSIGELLQRYLREKELLLVLDNFEHVVSAVELVAELLAACPQLKILVTSRAALRVQAEHQFPVAPLALPDLVQFPSVTALIDNPAVALFVERVQAVRPDFALLEENAQAVAAVCVRLDGLPLAIELAAGRCKLLPPKALLARLDQRLTLLSGGPRDLPARQQTLRDTIAWSYELLDAVEQTLFARLGVFVGGCTLVAAEAVLANDRSGVAADLTVFISASAVLEGLTSLIDKSLLKQADLDGEPRFVMLETIREYARDQLEARGEMTVLQRRHLEYYLAFAEKAVPRQPGVDRMYWLDQLEHEHDNLRTALQSALDRHASEIAGRLCVALGEFWLFRGHFSEGLHWIDSVLSQESALSLAVRMQLLQRAGGLAFQRSDLARARLLYEESLALARELRDPYLTSTALDGVALMFRKQGNLARARALSEESLTLLRNLGMTKEIPWSLFRLGQVVLRQGKHGEAQALGTECLESFRKLKDSVGVAHVLGLLGEIMSRRGDYEQAATLLRESLTLARDTGVMLVVALGLVRLAGGDTARTHPEQAVRLFSAMERMLDSLDIRMTPAQRAEWDHNVSALCGHLDAEVHEVAWSVGRAMRLEQAIAEALAIGY